MTRIAGQSRDGSPKQMSEMGMSEAELVRLAADHPPPAGLNAQAEWYGMGRWLKRYGYYPRFLPLVPLTVHGAARVDPIATELRARPLVYLAHNQVVRDKWREASSSLAFVAGSAFVHYRRMQGIQKRPAAQGTVSFPIHSTHHITVDTDWPQYARELKALPERYHPVSVCLYWKDVQRGVHRVFMDEGLAVVTAGHMFDPRFIERFYTILAGHQYATTNSLTSAALYAVEMGLPLFLTGGSLDVTAVNKKDKNHPTGTYDLRGRHSLHQQVSDLFSSRSDVITPDQRDFVRAQLGIEDALPRWQLSLVLWSSFLVGIPYYGIRWIFRRARLLAKTWP